MCSANLNVPKLFAKTVPVSITDAFTTYFRSLFLAMEWKPISTVIMKKELLITITDNNDPFFLYNLQLSEDDYQRLRSSQNLLVDFSAFPQIVIDFLERCLDESSKPQPNYLLHLRMGEIIGSIVSCAQLDIEQSSVFRQVSLLSLKFLAATDSTVKLHMTNCFKNLKTENENLQQRLSYLEKDFKEKFSACESALERKTQELENVKKELSEEINKRENKYTNILMEEREKFLNKQREGENRLESERIDKETKLKIEISKLETTVSSLEAINKDLQNKKERLEKQLNDLRSHVLSAESELRLKSEALTIAEKRNFQFDAELKETHSRINHLMKNINKLNEDLNDKQRQLNCVQKDLESSKKEKKKIIKDFEEAKNELKEAKLDASKAKQIIEKMQIGIRDDCKKNKMLLEQVAKLEGKLVEKEHALQYLKKDIEKERETNFQLAIEVQHVPILRAQVAELDKKKRELQMVNEDLTKLMFSNGITPQYVPPPHFAENLPATNKTGSGDDGLHRKENFAAVAAAPPSKTIPPNNPLVQKDFQSESRHMRKSLSGKCANSPVYTANHSQPEVRLLGNSVNSPPQDFNSKASTILESDKNANRSKLEVNSNGLSAEFKGLNVSRHSTARKSSKSSHIPVKS